MFIMLLFLILDDIISFFYLGYFCNRRLLHCVSYTLALKGIVIRIGRRSRSIISNLVTDLWMAYVFWERSQIFYIKTTGKLNESIFLLSIDDLSPNRANAPCENVGRNGSRYSMISWSDILSISSICSIRSKNSMNGSVDPVSFNFNIIDSTLISSMT